MSRRVRISEPALRWIENEAERIAENFGHPAAAEFKKRLEKAIENLADFPQLTKRGAIPGSRTMTVHKRTILTIVERDGELVIAAARAHWQGDAHEPHEAYSTDEGAGTEDEV
jgi:plasmid stabilization system protein ParE